MVRCGTVVPDELSVAFPDQEPDEQRGASEGKEDAEYILSTFPIVRKNDERDFNGRYVTRDLILAQMDALAAGDVDAVISLR